MTPTANTNSTTQADTEPETTRARLFATCQIAVDRLEPGTEFILSELLGEQVWAQYSELIHPTLLGNLFSDAVRDGTIQRVTSVGIRSRGRNALWCRTE